MNNSSSIAGATYSIGVGATDVSKLSIGPQTGDVINPLPEKTGEKSSEPGSDPKPSITELTEGAESVSDASSTGEPEPVPVEPEPISEDELKDEEEVNQEKLAEIAAKQAEALAPLGAEAVSEPESGEEMDSDLSAPNSPSG